MSTFHPVAERPCFPEEEEKILQYWKEIDAFQTSLKMSEGKPLYTFYDGPPFATGLPHYGHILAGTIKDVVTRYAHQTGHHVERRFGWDCHGLPVEYEIDKKLEIKGRKDVLALGIDKYNEECRSIVMRYSSQWKDVVERMGRWIDFEKDYKTLDRSFMESVWWVFKQLFEKGLVYRAFKVMPYSTACNTPLSNFEANLNYKEDVQDPSIVIAFSQVEAPHVEFLAWTTTPWTLPSNLALCVHPALTYVRVKNLKTEKEFIIGESRLSWLCKELKLDEQKDVKVLDKLLGKQLEGIRYQPLFPFFNRGHFKDNAFRVISDNYVTDDSGTGIVHCAPAFGEDDYRVAVAWKIIELGGELPCPVDDNGCFTNQVPDFEGKFVKDADKDVRTHLKNAGRLLYNGTFAHSYPFCWRSDTPLIYKAVPSWFVKVESLREKLLANNAKSTWVPAAIQEKRFHNWLEDARDWCISRNRYWGTPVPLWVNADFSEIVCIGSVEELEKHAGRKLPDIHRHFIDDITIPSKTPGAPPLRRVDEVFDCWFESGSMPYGQLHYPFENADKFAKGFPADFIAEGLDQTRGWFYTLLVLSTALFDKPAWKNLIVNGLVLAADGKKMSKRLKNYPDPMEVVNAHGADAIRLYLINSPVVRAEPLRFKQEGVKDVVRDVFLPWFNAYRFLLQEVSRFESNGEKFHPDTAAVQASTNVMDRWIYAATQGLIKYVREEMAAYRLYTVVPGLLKFLDNLTNWYLRLNRDRMRGSGGKEDAHAALCTLFEVLLTITKLMAPFTPFMSEYIYQNLQRALPAGSPDKQKSVHFVEVPPFLPAFVNPAIEEQIDRMQKVIELGRTMRERRKVGLKTPLKSMKVFHADPAYVAGIESLAAYVKEELNVLELEFSTDTRFIKLSALPNNLTLGPRCGKNFGNVRKAVTALTPAQLEEFEKTGTIVVAGETLGREDLLLKREPTDMKGKNVDADSNGSVLVMLDFTSDESLLQMAMAREVANRVQKLRKKAGLTQEDPIDMWASAATPALQQVLAAQSAYIDRCLRRPLRKLEVRQGHEVTVHQEDYDINGEQLKVVLTLNTVHFNQPALLALAGGDKALANLLSSHVKTYDLAALKAACEKAGGKLKVKVEAKEFVLVNGTHFSLGVSSATWLN